MLTLDDTRGVGVSRMMTSANFVNPALFFLTILFVQETKYDDCFLGGPFSSLLLFVLSKI